MNDLPAGVMVAILLVPQAIAYAYLAGMPPQYGLYTAIIPIILYTILGTSPHLAIGPVAISALLVLAGISKLADPFSDRYIELTIFAGLLIGIVQLLLGVIKMGKLVNLLSYPVIIGFTSAASIIVITSQMKDVLGIQVDQFDFLPQTIMHMLKRLNETHLLTFAMAICSFLAIYGLKKISKKIPSGLVVVIIGIVISYFFDLESKGVDIIGFVPSGLPSFDTPTISISDSIALIPTVLLVSFIGIIECIGIAKAIENKNNHYVVNTNQELIAIGVSKIGGSFFSSIPSSASFSRSALLHETKARTTIASLLTVLFVVLALLHLTPLLHYLPKVILAVIIIYAVKNLFEFKIAKKLYKIHSFDFGITLITFLVILFWSIEIGVAIGFIASFFTLFSTKKSRLKEFFKIFRQNHSEHISFSEESSSEPKATLLINKNLHFGNASFFKEKIKSKISEENQIEELEIQFAKDIDMDSTAIKSLNEMQIQLNSKNIKLVLTTSNKKLLQRLEDSK